MVTLTVAEPEAVDELGLAPVDERPEDRETSEKSTEVATQPVDEPLLKMDEAKQQISAEILSTLAEKFKGKLSRVRRLDEKDMLFSKGEPNINMNHTT